MCSSREAMSTLSKILLNKSFSEKRMVISYYLLPDLKVISYYLLSITYYLIKVITYIYCYTNTSYLPFSKHIKKN